MSCGKDEDVLSRVIQGDVEIDTVRNISHHNPTEDFETIEVRRVPIIKRDCKESKTTIKSKSRNKQVIFRDDLKRDKK